MSLPKLLRTTKQKLKPSATLSLTGGGPTAAATLPFNQQTQEQDQWCWSAVTVSVSRHYDASSSWTQCSLVNTELNRGDCCWDGSGSDCNKPWTLDRPLSRTDNLDRMQGSSAPFSDLIVEIDQSRPLACRIGWFSGGGHFVVLHGYSDSDQGSWVTVADPFYGPSTYVYDVFRSSYRSSGSWTHSYYTQQ